MQKKNYSFRHLPFSQLFQTYVSDFSKLNSFYQTNPFDEEAIKKHVQDFQFAGDRQRLVEILEHFNIPFDLDERAQENIRRLEEEDALVIVTGQQMGIYGGPLYTVLKTISTIHLSRQMEDLLDRPVIPIFWLADEDHDYDEVSKLNLLNRDQLQSCALPSRSQPLPPVANITLPDGELTAFKEEVQSALFETDFSSDLWELLDACYQSGRTFGQAFGHLISRLFSKHGVVLAGSNHSEVKSLVSGTLKRSISDVEGIKRCLKKKTEEIGEAFHQQVTLYDSNLFYLEENGQRIKINRADENHWSIENGWKWTTEELLNDIEKHPEQYSPNVFLRPLVQDRLLPTLGYVAGPGEIAYYGQMKGLYSCFDMEMPVIFPRISATIMGPAIDRIFDELPFAFHDYSQRIEDLESAYVEQSDQIDIEAVFSDWKEKVESIAKPKREEVAEVDATLDGAAGKATAVYFGELDKLKGKVYRAVKQQDETQLKRIRKIHQHLFPEGSLQERSIAAIYFMNKFGIDIWDKLLAQLEDGEDFSKHKLIYVQ